MIGCQDDMTSGRFDSYISLLTTSYMITSVTNCKIVTAQHAGRIKIQSFKIMTQCHHVQFPAFALHSISLVL